jgi:hypothetical protein
MQNNLLHHSADIPPTQPALSMRAENNQIHVFAFCKINDALRRQAFHNHFLNLKVVFPQASGDMIKIEFRLTFFKMPV